MLESNSPCSEKLWLANRRRDVQQRVLIVVVAVFHRPVVVDARTRGQNAEARHRARAGDAEAVFAVGSAFGQHIELRRGAGLRG